MATQEKMQKSLEALKNLSKSKQQPSEISKKKEKIQYCYLLTEAISNPNTRIPNNFHIFLSSCVEVLLSLCDDQDADIRMTSEECLNRIIRAADGHIGKIQIELHKEIKRNGAARSLRAALWLFSVLAHHIRPHKGKPFAVNVFPNIVKITERSEESIHETLAAALPKIMTVLGCFTMENEIKVLLKAFLNNITNESAVIRRTNTSCIFTICEHCRKPNVFTMYCFNYLLDLLIPIKKDLSSSVILGVMSCIKSLLPNLSKPHSEWNEKSKDNLLEKLLQIFELCVLFLDHKDHNVINVCLETLNSLLLSTVDDLKQMLLSENGIGDHRVFSSGSSNKLNFRSPSQISVATNMTTEDNLFSESELTETIHSDIEKWIDASKLSVMNIHFGNSKEKSHSLEKLHSFNPETEENLDICDFGKINEIYKEPFFSKLKTHSLENTLDISSLSDNSSEKSNTVDGKNLNLEGELLDIDIGDILEGKPLIHCIRKISKLFLLSGTPGTYLSDKTTRVSVKFLALSCLTTIFKLYPLGIFIHLDKNFVCPKITSRQICSQFVSDVFLFKNHPDPQLRGAVRTMTGIFLKSVSRLCQGDYDSWIRSNGNTEQVGVLQTEEIITIFIEGLNDESSTCIRQTLMSLNTCLKYLMVSQHNSKIIPLLDVLPVLAQNPYWLVKCELCNLVSKIDYISLQFIMESDHFQDKVIWNVLLVLLDDKDQRVRVSAATSLVEIIPRLYHEEYFTNENISTSKAILDTNILMECLQDTEIETSINKKHFVEQMPSPLNRISERRCDRIEFSLSKIIMRIQNVLLTSTSKYLLNGCIETLSLLSQKYPCTVYKKSWGTDSILNCDDIKIPDLLKFCLSLMTSTVHVYGLQTHIDLLNLTINLYAGHTLSQLKPTDAETNLSPWSMFSNPAFRDLSESYLNHSLKMLSVFHHVLNDVPPTPPQAKAVLPNLPAPSTLSPLKRRKSDLDKKSVSGSKTDVRDERVGKAALGCFAQAPHYMKIYETLKAAFSNYKMSLDSESSKKFLELLTMTLHSLSVLMEVGSFKEFEKIAEDILVYFRSTFAVEAATTVGCVQQLLKCLFSTNLTANVNEFTTKIIREEEREGGFYYNVFQKPYNLISKYTEALNNMGRHDLDDDSTVMGYLHRKDVKPRPVVLSRSSDKVLASYIRIFEPMVIKSLKQYTITSDVKLQCQVLQLLCQLVQLRVNYCLLDSEQVFIGFVLKQFEYIEEGQIMSAEHLIRKIFQFLVQLSYSKHHSKCIIGVPKIINLCDGLMASGQPSLTHCIPALQPIVEDIFLTRNKSNTSDVKELETTREVVLSMLLRLCDNRQVLDLITLILEDSKYCTDNTDKWFEWSKRVFGVVLPLLKQNKLQLEHSEALATMRRFVLALNPDVFKPFDTIIVMFFQDLPSLETDLKTYNNWLSKILILLLIVTSLKEELLLSKINKLKSEFSPNSIFENVPTKADPLNVNNNADTFQKVPAELVFIRFLFRVVSVTSKMCLKVVRDEKETFIFEQLCQFLLHCLYLFQSGSHCRFTSAAASVINKNVPFDENNVINLNDINNNFVSLAAFYPILTSEWCNLLTFLNFNNNSFWTTVLKNDNQHSLNSKIMNVGSAISFCDYLNENMADIENITWFLKTCSPLLVELSVEPPVSEFISSIHGHSSTSKVFIENLMTNAKTHNSSVFKVKLLKCIENCHSSQIGAVLNLLIPDLLRCHQAVLSRMVANMASRKIEMLLTMSVQDVNEQLSNENLNRILQPFVSSNLFKKHETLSSLLNKLSVQCYGLEPLKFEQHRLVEPERVKRLVIDRRWYLSQIEAKFGDPSVGKETAHLLDRLEYSEILSCASSSAFNKACLRDCLRLGQADAGKRWPRAESDLERASVDCLVKDVASLAAKIPRPHQVFHPAGRQESPAERIYYNGLSSLFESREFSELLRSTAVCMPAFLNRIQGADDHPNRLSDNNWRELMEIGVTFLEYITQLSVAGVGEVEVHLIDSLLTASERIMRNANVSVLLGSEDHVTWLCSSINSLYRLVDCQLRGDRPLPVIPCYALSDSLSHADSQAAGRAVNQAYTLSCWLFEQRAGNSTRVPDFLFDTMRSLTVCLCRAPLVNSYVSVPNGGWKTGWLPEKVSGAFKTKVPSLPIELLQEIDILEEYIFRISLLGWTTRQQFEETWMCLLSVLCAPLDDLDALDLNDVLQASSLAIKAITALLLETLNEPIPGNPNVSKLRHISRNFPISDDDLGVSKLKNIQNRIQLSYISSDVDDHSIISNVFENRNFEKNCDTFTYGQVSVQYFMIATGDFRECEENFAVSEVCRKRRKMLKDSGLDINSCLQFLIDYYTQLMKPQTNTHIRILHEAVRSTVMISDLFMDKSQFSWMMEVFLELSKLHHAEDEFLHQYLIVGVCKAVAVLTPDIEIYEQVKKMLMQFFKSPYLTSKIACLYGVLYILEGSKLSNIIIGAISEEMQLILPCAIEYVQLNLNTTNSVLKKSQEHSNLLWSLAFYLIENIEEIHMEQNFVPNTLSTAFSLLQENCNRNLHNRLMKNLERLLITKKSMMLENYAKHFLKLALDKMRSDNPMTALLGTQLLITYMYTDCAHHLQTTQNPANTPTSPDHLVQTIEKISAIFERIKRGYTSEVEILCSVLPDILNDFFSPADILTKVIGEFLSSQQPHPKLLSKVVFKVFESAIQQNQLALLQDWVVFSLPNFTQSFSIGMATWCLTCFFISASTNGWLRAYFSYVQTRVGRYEYEDRKMLCIAGADFYGNLTSDGQRKMFVDNFEKVKNQPDTPFNDLLQSL